MVDNPGELPAKGDIVDLGYKSPGAPFENKIEEAKNEIKIYVIHNFKIMRENGTKESGPSTPGSSTPRSSSRESPNPERSPMGPPTSSRPCPGPSTPSSTSSADHTPTPHRWLHNHWCKPFTQHLYTRRFLCNIPFTDRLRGHLTNSSTARPPSHPTQPPPRRHP